MDKQEKKFAVGDTVIVTKVVCKNDVAYFNVGHVGVYIGDTRVDFNNQDNSFVADDGMWYVEEEYLELYEQKEEKQVVPVEDMPLWEANHMYLDDEQKATLRGLLERVQRDEGYAEKIKFNMKAEDIGSAFFWDETDEGHNVWSDIEEQCQYPTYVEEKAVPFNQDETSSEYFLQRAIDLQKERGKEYDSGKERSMNKNVTVFNIITGHTLTEADGWLFMQLLKDVRQWTKPTYHKDSAEDCVSYAALKAEALANGK